MLIEQMTCKEWDTMDIWRRRCAASNEGKIIGTYAPITEVLKVWERSKSEYLYKLFGEQLQISKHIDYSKSHEQLVLEIEQMFQDGVYGRKERIGSTFHSLWNKYIWDHRMELDWEQELGLHRLIDPDTLADNVFSGKSFEIEDAKGKRHKIHTGCKASRAIGKLVKIFGLNPEAWEDFRICHSQILNQKNLGGTLTLSIHPMDYMTMSDNEYDWDSCMSWLGQGDYRRGTVEMMNSVSVVVAYIAGEDTSMNIGDGHTWNNKKWRQLFVVTEEAILAVKGYPYYNFDLSCAIVEWLADLAHKNLGWEYGEVQKYQNGGELPSLTTGEEFSISLDIGDMYNDLGCAEHCVCFNPNLAVDDLEGNYGYWLNLPYSGLGQCMVCGKTENKTDFDFAYSLACNCCEEIDYCDCCNDPIPHGGGYRVDDYRVYCNDCYDNHVLCCAECEELNLDEEMKLIYVLPRLTEADTEIMRENAYWQLGSEDSYELQFNSPLTIPVCNEHCLNNWAESNLVEEACPHIRLWPRYSKQEHICVYFDDLTPEFRETITHHKTNEDFKTSLFTLWSWADRIVGTRFVSLI